MNPGLELLKLGLELVGVLPFAEVSSEALPDPGPLQVLIDTRRQISSPNTLHLFDFAASLPVALRFAVVVSEALKNDLDFVETVGRNRGKSIRLFADYEQALEWLDPGD